MKKAITLILFVFLLSSVYATDVGQPRLVFEADDRNAVATAITTVAQARITQIDNSIATEGDFQAVANLRAAKAALESLVQSAQDPGEAYTTPRALGLGYRVDRYDIRLSPEQFNTYYTEILPRTQDIQNSLTYERYVGGGGANIWESYSSQEAWIPSESNRRQLTAAEQIKLEIETGSRLDVQRQPHAQAPSTDEETEIAQAESPFFGEDWEADDNFGYQDGAFCPA